MADIVKYLQEKLDAIAPDVYSVSNERNVATDYSQIEVVVSALSGDIYKESSNIPYQIEIVTADIDRVMIDFTTLAKNNNNVSYTEIIALDEDDYQSSTITPFFNSPVVIEKDIEIGSNRYARIVVFAQITEKFNVNNIKSLTIDGEAVDFLTGSFTYNAELNPSRVSGVELSKSKKKVASCSITIGMINAATVFTNKAFRVATGVLPGNTAFNVVVTLDNNLSATLKMLIGSYTLASERTKLPSINVGLFVYDDRGDSNA